VRVAAHEGDVNDIPVSSALEKKNNSGKHDRKQNHCADKRKCPAAPEK
jgi:hypothetical protein